VFFSVVVLLPLSGALLVVVVVVDFCVTSGDGDDSAAGEVSVVVVVVVVSFVVPLHPTIIVPAMKANATTAVNETIHFEIFMGRGYQNSMILHRVVTIKDSNLVGANASSIRPGDRHRTILI
jgi:hypothetical protein